MPTVRLPGLEVLKRNEAILILVTTTAIAMLGNGIIAPVLPLYAKSFGVSIFLVGVMIAAYGVARICMDIPAGRMADRFGRRPMIVAGSALMSLSSLATAMATDFWQLVALRFVMGTGSAIYVITSQSALADLSTLQTRGRLLSLHQGSHQVGNSLGPALGGFLAEFLGLRAPFYAFAIIAFVAAVWAYYRVPETSPSRSGEPAPVRPAGTEHSQSQQRHGHSGSVAKILLVDSSFLLVAFLTFNNFISHGGAQQTIIPLYGTTRLGLTEGQLGLAMTAIGIMTLLTSFFGGWLSDRVGRKKVIVPGMFGLGLSLALFGLSTNVALFVLAAAVMGTARGFAGSVPAAYAADIAPGGNFGATLGLFRTFGDIGMVTGPLLMGWIADSTGSLSLSLFVGSGLLVTGGALFGLFARETVNVKTKRPQPETSIR